MSTTCERVQNQMLEKKQKISKTYLRNGEYYRILSHSVMENGLHEKMSICLQLPTVRLYRTIPRLIY